MRLCALSHFTVVVCVLSLPAASIYADEAYQTDYHHPLLGLPQSQTTFFHRPSTNSKAALVYTLSEKHVLGAVNPKDGVLLWRQRLSDRRENLTTPGLLKAGDSADTVVSAVEGLVQAWGVIDGRLAWESRGHEKVKALEVLSEAEGEGDVLVACEVSGASAVVKRLAAESGEAKWSHTDTSGNVPFAIVSSKDAIFYLSLHTGLLGGYQFSITKLYSSNGESHGQLAMPTDNEVGSEDLILFAGNSAGTPILVWTDKHLKTIKVNMIGSKHVTTITIKTKTGETVDRVVVHAAQPSGAAPHFLVQYQSKSANWAEVFHFSPETAKATKAYELPPIGGQNAFSVSILASEVYFTRHSSSEITLYSSKDAAMLGEWKIQGRPKTVEPQGPMHVTSEVVLRSGSKYSLRSAIAFPSGDWQMIRNGDLLWSRPEGLTGIVAAGFVDTAAKEDLLEELAIESHSSLLGAYLHRVKRHGKQLQYLPEWIREIPDHLFGSFLGGKANSQIQAQQHPGFGFNKLVIIATGGGRLAALDTADCGKQLWNIQAVTLPAGQKWNVLSIDPEVGSVLVRGVGGEFLRVSTSSGTITAYQPGAMVSSLKTSIPVADTQGGKELIPINFDGSLGDIPKSDFAKGIVILTKSEDNTVRAWKPSKKSKATFLWQFKPEAGEKIKSVESPPAHDPVASIGKALGDRNVLYKYLNPSILLITAIGSSTSTASFYVVDSTSGALLYSAAHSGVDISQPISSTITENWFAYSLFSESNTISQDSTQLDQQPIKGHQLIVSELFESPFPNDRGPLGESHNISSTHPVIADEDELVENPHVISQTFLIPGPISHMTTTSTLQGITPRSLLCTVPHLSALMAIPRHILDPRRPVGRDPTPLEAEEGLFRYSPLLDFEPKWMLNHKREVLSISDVITSPSKLESTSLVFAYGDIDFFGTRIAPIGSFDMLGKGFSKLQLIGTVVALIFGTGLVAPFVRRKQIDGQWKA